VSDPYRHLLSFALEHPWAATPTLCQTVAEIIARKVAGVRLSADEIQARLQDRARLPEPPATGGAVQVIPIHGAIVPRGNMLTDVSGATSLDSLQAQLDDALADDTVKSILLDIDSPGGSVAGVTEFARSVMAARTKKYIVAHARYTAASAALWIGAAAKDFIASPSARVGSLGVYAIHEDVSKALEAEGIKRTLIASDPQKIDGHRAEPLTATARADIQKVVDTAAARFRQDVAHGRGIKVDDVKAKFGEGRMFSADEALSVGMIDGIATFEQTVERLMGGAPQRRLTAADATDAPIVATDQDPARDTSQEQRQAARRADERDFERQLFGILVTG
jgi:signal peptide peptidase SppA